MSIKIVVVEDHPAMRYGLVAAISAEPDMKVIGEAANAEDGLRRIRRLQPDIVILDINLPGATNGIQLLQRMVAERLPTRVFVLSGYSDPYQVKQVMKSGAVSYLTKDSSIDQIVEAIRLIANGQYVVENRKFDSEEALKDWLSGKQRASAMPPLSDDPAFQKTTPLAPREMEIVIQIALGKRNDEIAEHLGIGTQVVKNYVTAILRKLGLNDRTQVATYAIRMGWVSIHR